MESFVLIKGFDFEDSEHVQAEYNDHDTRNFVQNLFPGDQKLSNRCCGCAKSNECDREPDNEHDRVQYHRPLQRCILVTALQLIQ